MTLVVVVLPQPDSPTRASVSPRFSEKLTFSTARTQPMVFLSATPFVTGKCLVSPSNCMTTSPRSLTVEPIALLASSTLPGVHLRFRAPADRPLDTDPSRRRIEVQNDNQLAG